MINLKALWLVLLVLPSTLFAETIYKWRGTDGVMNYSATPPSEEVEAEIISIKPSSSANKQDRSRTNSQWRQQSLNASKALDRKTNARIQHRKDLQAQLKQAKNKLEQAKRTLAEGQAPLAGERVGRAGGGTRLGPAYQKRINGLEKNIEAAQLNIKKIKRSLRELPR